MITEEGDMTTTTTTTVVTNNRILLEVTQITTGDEEVAAVVVLVVEEVIEGGVMIIEIVVDLIEEVTITHNSLTPILVEVVDLDLDCNLNLGPLQFLKKRRMKKNLEVKRKKNPSLNSKMKNLRKTTQKPKHKKRKVPVLNNLNKRMQMIVGIQRKNMSKGNLKLSTRELPHWSRHPLVDAM